jgi:hypothetical protein
MSITLSASNGDLKINAWNWGVLHALVASAAVFPEEIWESKRYNGGGVLDSDQIAVLADFLESNVLPSIAVGQRMFFDGTVTAEPDDGTFYREESELWRNYSLHHDVLVDIIGFLHASAGPVAFH